MGGFPFLGLGKRTSIKQTPVNDSPIPARLFADGDGTTLVIAKKIKQSKTKNFANATSLRLYKQNNFKFKNEKIVYEYVTVPLPIYHDFSYTINLRAEYQQQINDMIQPFAAFSNRDFKAFEGSGNTLTGGFNFFVNTHQAKITLEFNSTQPCYNQLKPDRENQIRLQAMVYL